jgi:plastocyanin
MKRGFFVELAGLFVLFAVAIPQVAKAQTTWTATVGAETKDQSVQANGFFVNELWIDEGDSIVWRWVPVNEIHTVTFLGSAIARPTPPPPVGPVPPIPMTPPFYFGQHTSGNPAFNNNCQVLGSGSSTTFTPATSCASSGVLDDGATFKVTSPAGSAGDYKFVCLIHTDMTGTVHVRAKGAAYPYTQVEYTKKGLDEAEDVLKDGDDQREEVRDNNSTNEIAGTGEIVATGGGTQYRAVVRFLKGVLHIKAGDTVTWTNLDPTEPHTVTFGTEPANFNPMAVVGFTHGLTETATIVCSPRPVACDKDYMQITDAVQVFNPAIFLNSGFLQATAPDATGSVENMLTPTRVSITFPTPGDFYYHCALHDVDGMYGEVIVK